MIEQNHEYYVSLEVAKLLKEAGFDWECTAYYLRDNFYEISIVRDGDIDYNSNMCQPYADMYSAPTLEVAQRWLREVKNMSVEISFENPGKWSCCVILDTNKGISFENFWREEFDYDTYEEAQEAGIKKALEIILEKGE